MATDHVFAHISMDILYSIGRCSSMCFDYLSTDEDILLLSLVVSIVLRKYISGSELLGYGALPNVRLSIDRHGGITSEFTIGSATAVSSYAIIMLLAADAGGLALTHGIYFANRPIDIFSIS